MIVEFENKYLEDVKDLLVELEQFILKIDRDNLDTLHPNYRDEYTKIALENINKNEGKCYLYVENGKVLGLIMGEVMKYSSSDYLDYKCPKQGNITELIVSEKARKSGIGKELMKKMENHFKTIGCEWIKVSVFAYNENAINFYNKNGYHSRMEDMIKKIN